MKFFENFRNLKIYKASGTTCSRSVVIVLSQIQKTAHICTAACTELVKSLAQSNTCVDLLSPPNLKGKNNNQSSKHKPVTYYTEAIKDFKIADN